MERRKVYAVGLDVYKNEPNLNPGYLKHKSAFILPHLGSATKETRTAMANLAIDNIDEFFIIQILSAPFLLRIELITD